MIAILSAAFLSCACCALAIATAGRMHALASPNAIVRQHERAVPHLGGVAIAISALLAGAGGHLFLCGAPFLAAGMLDDFVKLRPAPKFATQAVAAALATGLGIRAEIFSIPALDVAVSMFWILTMVNAFNFVDVSDGVAGGIACVALAALAAAGVESAGSLATLASAFAGFLLLNLPPASIFLGDAGSHLAGFAVAAGTLELLRAGGPWPAIAQGALICSVPLLELSFITTIRICKGLPWWKGSPDHFAIRLQAAGLSRLKVALFAWSAAAVPAVLGAAFPFLPAIMQVTALVTMVVVSAVFWRMLLRFEPLPDRRKASAVSTSAI